jgi:hypothetical protein
MKYLAVSSTFALLCATAAILHSAVADHNSSYPLPIDFGAATSYAVLAATTVTSTVVVVGTVVDGNLGVYPGSAVEGFPPAKVNGAIDTANGASGAAQGSLTTAYNTLAGLAADADLTSSDLGGRYASPYPSTPYRYPKPCSLYPISGLFSPACTSSLAPPP